MCNEEDKGGKIGSEVSFPNIDTVHPGMKGTVTID